jgi:hypothetical protein
MGVDWLGRTVFGGNAGMKALRKGVKPYGKGEGIYGHH